MGNEQTDQRAEYIARYGKDAWTEALRLATRHRGRARNERGLTEHFNASEWLDLCAEFSFVCPWCHNPAKLTPHHRNELHDGGANTIDNLLPLCWPCHQRLHGWLMSCAPDWLAQQKALCEGFRVGDRVQYRDPLLGSVRKAILQITEIVPPAPVSQAKTARRRAWNNWGAAYDGGLIVEGVTVTHWKQAMARTMRPGGKEDPPRWGYSLEHLVLAESVGGMEEHGAGKEENCLIVVNLDSNPL